jgi:hypothetical protein
LKSSSLFSTKTRSSPYNYKIEVTQHKHTIHSNIIKQIKQRVVIHRFYNIHLFYGQMENEGTAGGMACKDMNLID